MKTMGIFFAIFLFVLVSFTFNENEYKEEEVAFESSNVTLAGTLSVPLTNTYYPALVMITGGGNRNRDAQWGNFHPYKLIAEYLTPKGVAVLRYDDRGIGRSTGEKSVNCNLEDFADDATTAIEYLKNRKDLNISKIGVFGHCAGAQAALLAAAKSKHVSFIITMAPCGMTGEETLINETWTSLEKQGRDEVEIIELQWLRKQLFQVMREDAGWNNIENSIRLFSKRRFDALEPEERENYKDFDQFYKQSGDGMYINYGKTEYLKYFIDANPIPIYDECKNPILLLFGENDISVPAKYHAKPIEYALQKSGNDDYQISIIPDADHYFVKDWDTNLFAPGFLPAIGEWMDKNILN